ncbi:hypothetical protein FRC06_005090, partial [Ceratobasidium sp. 370]
TNKRKLLLSLIDELTELRDEEEREKEINYEPTENERSNDDIAGVERFRLFNERCHKLGLKLLSFTRKIQQLGSNATGQFDDVTHGLNLGTKPYRSHRNPSRVQRPIIQPTSDIEELPEEMEALAKDLHDFLDRINVTEFTDEAINLSIMAFTDDLMYQASCLREFEGQLKFRAVAKYINDLSEELGEHMDRMKDSLDIFIDVGIPIIRTSQVDLATSLQGLSAVATFFSSVTATTIQTKGDRWLPEILEELSERTGVFAYMTSVKRAASMDVKRTRTFVGEIKRLMTDTTRRATGVTGRMTEAMTSLVPRALVGRSMSALSIANGSDQRDEESQGGTMRTDSPTNMFGTDNGSGSLGINVTSEKRKLSDIGKGVEDTIHEDLPLI